MTTHLSNSATIVAVSSQLVRFPIFIPFSIALESLAAAEIVVVTVKDSEGRIGLGEAAPFPTLTYDTPKSALAALNAISSGLVGKTPEVALKLLDEEQELRAASVTAFCGLECALIDLMAKERGVSLAQFHGAAGLRDIESDITLPIMPVVNVPGFYELFATYDFRTVKIKVSGNVSADEDLVHAVLKLFPSGTTFTLDGNQGFDVTRARQLTERLIGQNLRPLFFEQPLPEKDWVGVANLSNEMSVPICLDESVRNLADLEKVIDENLPVMINLKIMKSGLRQTAAIIDRAKSRGIEMMIGGMLESEIAMGHSLHLACGRGGVRYFDLDTPFFFRSGPTLKNPWTAKKARLFLPKGQGIGLELDPTVVNE